MSAAKKAKPKSETTRHVADSFRDDIELVEYETVQFDDLKPSDGGPPAMLVLSLDVFGEAQLPDCIQLVDQLLRALDIYERHLGGFGVVLDRQLTQADGQTLALVLRPRDIRGSWERFSEIGSHLGLREAELQGGDLEWESSSEIGSQLGSTEVMLHGYDLDNEPSFMHAHVPGQWQDALTRVLEQWQDSISRGSAENTHPKSIMIEAAERLRQGFGLRSEVRSGLAP